MHDTQAQHASCGHHELGSEEHRLDLGCQPGHVGGHHRHREHLACVALQEHALGVSGFGVDEETVRGTD